MKKIAFASVATLGLLGTAVVPAFGATSLTQSQQQTAQISAAANVHCKVKHWAHRRGYRDAIRGDAFQGRKGHFGHGHNRDEFRKEVDFNRNRDHHEHKDHVNDADAVEDDGLVRDRHHHKRHHHKKVPYDVEVHGHKNHEGRGGRDHLIWHRDAGRAAQRWDERKLWGTEKWCKGRPVAGVAAGGGWHAKSKRK